MIRKIGNRIALTTIAGAAAVVLLAFGARAAQAPAPVPVVTMTGHVTPSRQPIPPGTPVRLRLHVVFSSNPVGGDFVLQGIDFMIHSDARLNGALFPSCSVSRLLAAHGDLHVCPKGSQIGDGTASGRAVALGVSATGRLAIFNGPGGKSFTANFSLLQPAMINVTWSDPIVYVHSRRTILIHEREPPEFQTVLGSDIDVTKLDFGLSATRIVHGKRRGYVEAGRCHRRTAIDTTYFFRGGATTSTKLTSACL